MPPAKVVIHLVTGLEDAERRASRRDDAPLGMDRR
jgi:hypothetical protein